MPAWHMCPWLQRPLLQRVHDGLWPHGAIAALPPACPLREPGRCCQVRTWRCFLGPHLGFYAGFARQFRLSGDPSSTCPPPDVSALTASRVMATPVCAVTPVPAQTAGAAQKTSVSPQPAPFRQFPQGQGGGGLSGPPPCVIETWLLQAECIPGARGSYNCTCHKGWSGDGRVCVAIDECELDARGGCHKDALCSYVGPGQVRHGSGEGDAGLRAGGLPLCHSRHWGTPWNPGCKLGTCLEL